MYVFFIFIGSAGRGRHELATGGYNLVSGGTSEVGKVGGIAGRFGRIYPEKSDFIHYKLDFSAPSGVDVP